MWINSEIKCRVCLKQDKNVFGYGYSKVLDDLDKKTIEEYYEKTEFEVVALIEQWFKESNQTCPFCNSDNIEFLNVQIGEDDYELFNYQKFTNLINENNNFFILKHILKDNNELKFSTRISEFYNDTLLLTTKDEIIKIITNSPANKFIPNSNGLFYLFISAYKNNKNNYVFKIERFINYGITREEILKTLNNEI